MSQWHALNVNVVKTRRIECGKLNIPEALKRSPESCAAKNTSSNPAKLASMEKEKLNTYSPDYQQELRKDHSSGDGLISLTHFSPKDSLNSSLTEDEVFQESFETPPERDGSFRKSSTKRCLSLPANLSVEYGYANDGASNICFRPRCLFEEALNLESRLGSTGITRLVSIVDSLGSSDHTFPRQQENCIDEKKQSRTTHAARMKGNESSSVITFDRNNNSKVDHNGLEPKTRNNFDVRDWEQRVLVLTSDHEFGTELSKKPREESDARSRSVALTGNISTIANARSSKDLIPERQVKSESKSEMPKLQTVVWDYIKRKSTKRKRKNESSASAKQENVKPASQESSSEYVHNAADTGQDAACYVKSFHLDSTEKIGRNRSNISSSSKPLKSWNSTPNLKSSCEENFPLRRYNSFHLVYPQLTLATPPRLPAKERKVDSESLRFLLTTAPEEKPLHERMDTLRQSREWLLKELKSMREEDRRLARQFIHLRSAIVELREYCEKLELDYDSESDGSQKTNDTLHKDNKRSGLTERKIPIHNTPARNILNYC